MGAESCVLPTVATPRPAHPNDVDRKRIERALQARKRYRYVKPSVLAVADGYRVVSPCCSRNIDADGGVIDVALLLYDSNRALWQLYWKDHKAGRWQLHDSGDRLISLLDDLNADPERKFWQ